MQDNPTVGGKNYAAQRAAIRQSISPLKLSESFVFIGDRLLATLRSMILSRYRQSHLLVQKDAN
jgi:hypothetical protein